MEPINIALESFACIVTLLILTCAFLAKWERGLPEKLFTTLLFLNAAVLLVDIATYSIPNRPENDTIMTALNALVFILGYCITAVFSFFLFATASIQRKIPRWFPITISVLCALLSLLVVISAFTGILFRFENGIYVRGPFFPASHILPALLLLANMSAICLYKKELRWRKTLSMLSFCVIPLLAIALQTWSYRGINLLYLATTLSLLIINISIHIDQSIRLREKKDALEQTQIALMLSQIRPHFLYNALTSIAQLCEDNPAAAKRMTLEFSDYLRGNLDSLHTQRPISFARELQHTQHYLSIEQMRFGEKLRVEYDIEAEDFFLPALSLQPLAENAVKHGLGRTAQGGTLRLATREEEDAWKIMISDNGVGYRPEQNEIDGRSHIGIENVRARLAAQCGGTLEIRAMPEGGTLATISLPKRALL